MHGGFCINGAGDPQDGQGNGMPQEYDHLNHDPRRGDEIPQNQEASNEAVYESLSVACPENLRSMDRSHNSDYGAAERPASVSLSHGPTYVPKSQDPAKHGSFENDDQYRLSGSTERERAEDTGLLPADEAKSSSLACASNPCASTHATNQASIHSAVASQISNGMPQSEPSPPAEDGSRPEYEEIVGYEQVNYDPELEKEISRRFGNEARHIRVIDGRETPV